MNTTTTMDATSTSSTPTTSALFCSPTADIEFISSSNTLFKLHSTHLTPQTSAGLAQLATGSLDISDPVRLTESSEVLELLFQFIEPPSSDPNGGRGAVLLEEVEPTLFFAVAEAAEKYGVSGAISASHARMETLLPDYPLEILNHSTLHAHPTLADNAAYQALSTPLSSAALKLTAPGLLARYVTYYATWLHTANKILALFTAPSASHPCPRSAVLYTECRLALEADDGGGPHAIDRIPNIVRDAAIALDVMKVGCLGAVWGEKKGEGEGEGRCACEVDCGEVQERVRRMVEGMGRFSEVRVEGSE